MLPFPVLFCFVLSRCVLEIPVRQAFFIIVKQRNELPSSSTQTYHHRFFFWNNDVVMQDDPWHRPCFYLLARSVLVTRRRPVESYVSMYLMCLELVRSSYLSVSYWLFQCWKQYVWLFICGWNSTYFIGDVLVLWNCESQDDEVMTYHWSSWCV